MSVNFEYYRVFYYLSKYQNLTQAAAALMSSQPNVTRVMNNLENELGCRLFVRSNRGVSLTAEGERLYHYVALAYEQIQSGEDELMQNVRLQSGKVYIGASETALHGLLVRVLRDFNEQFPNVYLKIFNYSTSQALNALRNGQVDFAVVTTPIPTHKMMKEIQLRAFQDVLIGGTRFAHLANQTLHLKDVKEYPMICMSQNTAAYTFLEKFFSDHGLMLEPDIEVATMDLILLMIKNNLGLGFLPSAFAKEAFAKCEVVEFQ